MPIRDTPNNCCKSVPDCKCLNLDLTNLFIIWYDENNIRNGLYLFSETKKVFWRTFDAESGAISGGDNIPPFDRFGGINYTITDQNIIKFTTSDNRSYTFTLETNNDNNIISITKLMNKMGNITQNIYDVAETHTVSPIYSIRPINGLDGANIAFTVKDTFDEAKNTIIENFDTTYRTRIISYSVLGGYICNAISWISPDPDQELPTTSFYIIILIMSLELLHGDPNSVIFLGTSDENGNIIELSNAPCT
jgi:hypothetical protein